MKMHDRCETSAYPVFLRFTRIGLDFPTPLIHLLRAKAVDRLMTFSSRTNTCDSRMRTMRVPTVSSRHVIPARSGLSTFPEPAADFVSPGCHSTSHARFWTRISDKQAPEWQNVFISRSAGCGAQVGFEPCCRDSSHGSGSSAGCSCRDFATVAVRHSHTHSHRREASRQSTTHADPATKESIMAPLSNLQLPRLRILETRIPNVHIRVLCCPLTGIRSMPVVENAKACRSPLRPTNRCFPSGFFTSESRFVQFLL